MNSERRNQGLDLLRAFALLLVLFRHILRPMGGSPFRSNLILALNNGGWVGVDLFFVLSGFLIGGLLFDEQIASGGICIRRFYLRRGFKIYPLFWLTIAFLYLRSASSGNVPAPARVFHELLFLQNYLDGFRYVTWSLAVEEHFYLLLPLVLFCLAKGQSDPHRPYRYLPHAVAVVAAVCLACRLAVAHQRVNVLSHVTPTHLRIDGLFFGVLVA
jgi:peptidoglycan/LPS O-acetylase OafA/YrhL